MSSKKKTRDVMSDDCTCIGENDSVLDAAKRLAELDVGALPICGEDDRLKGMLTDRDLVVHVLAKGKAADETRAGDVGEGDSRRSRSARTIHRRGPANDDRP